MATTTRIIPDDAAAPATIAGQLGVTAKTVRNWTQQETDPLPHYRVGVQLRISLAEARAWIARRSGRGES